MVMGMKVGESSYTEKWESLNEQAEYNLTEQTHEKLGAKGKEAECI